MERERERERERFTRFRETEDSGLGMRKLFYATSAHKPCSWFRQGLGIGD